MDYKQAVDFIFGYTNYEVVPRTPHTMATYDLRRLYELLGKIGNPHTKAKSLHIAGTNGKGSTSAMLAAVLTNAGYTTGLYTSPHLITMRERIMVDGVPIPEESVARIMTRIRPEIEEVNRRATYGTLTVFELLTVLAFAYFAEKKVDFQVMEVGLGGRFDATNVIVPEVCLITSISFDHTEVLGNTLTAIASEKAGIIKPGCTVVLHPQVEEVDKVIREVCHQKDAKLIRVGKDVTRQSLGFNLDGQQMLVKGRLGSYSIAIPLLGQFQMDNATAAVAALEVLVEKEYKITADNIVKGLAAVEWPGRMHILRKKPIILVDGGHNPGASHNLKEALELYFKPEKAILVVGISNDKDYKSIVKEMAPLFDTVIATRAVNPRAYDPKIIADEFARAGLKTEVAESIPAAIDRAIVMAGEKDLICIAGSLFVVGEAIEHLNKAATSK
jgi:dihydrofolate synthase / folylpolyglutamate synthase